MYYDEDMLLDIRLNTLDKFVSKFIICEAKFKHNGAEKELKFDLKKFKKFENKINYIVVEEYPKNLHIIKDEVLYFSSILDKDNTRHQETF